MQYIIKSETSNGYYQGTICREHHFTYNAESALKFKSEKIAKATVKFHSIANAQIVAYPPLSLNVATK